MYQIPGISFALPAFHFGYNLIFGSVERQRLLNASNVTECIHAIWEEALAKAEANTYTVILCLCGLNHCWPIRLALTK
jgi:hypothetical protein